MIELHGDERSVTASVSDDGRGFDLRGSSDGGLAHMAERIEEVGGALSIRSDHRDGTTVRAEVHWPHRGSRSEGAQRKPARVVDVHRDCGTRHCARRPSVSGSVGLVDAEAGLNSFPSSPWAACSAL